ncbi:MAG: methyltransferase [Mycobacteriales bacterium]
METVPPQVQMVQMLAGFQVSQALYVAAKLGVADVLVDGPRSIDELAERVGADPAALGRLVRTLGSMGVFAAEPDGRYALGALGPTLVSEGEGSMRDLALMWMETHYVPFGGLLDGVRSGTTAATSHYGTPFFNWLSGEPNQVARFSHAMANLTNGIKAGAVASYDFSGAGRIVDLGGADGALLARVLHSTPEPTGVVFDLPHVIAAAATTVEGYGLGERLTQEAGDFFEAIPGDADTYVFSMVLHDWDDAHLAKILANIRAVARPGARVVAFELLLPADGGPHMAQMIDLTMLGMLDGRERTAAEFRSLFESAGFAFGGVTATATPISIIEATV